MRFNIQVQAGTFTGLAESPVIATDNTGSFIYGFTETYTQTPIAVGTALAVNSPVPMAQMVVTNSLTVTIGGLQIGSYTYNGVTYPLGAVWGKVYGATATTVAGVNLVALTTLSCSVNVQLMILGS